MKFIFVDRWTYRLEDFGGVENCTVCDVFEPVNEYTRLEDSRVMMLCSACVDDLKLP
jgi:hypothetical protein